MGGYRAHPEPDVEPLGAGRRGISKLLPIEPPEIEFCGRQRILAEGSEMEWGICEFLLFEKLRPEAPSPGAGQ